MVDHGRRTAAGRLDRDLALLDKIEAIGCLTFPENTLAGGEMSLHRTVRE